MEKITILLIDDHRLLREMWAFFLGTDQRFQVIGTASNGLEAITFTRKFTPDIILMDIAMTPMSGFELTRQICFYQGLSKIIGVSMYNIPAFAKKMLEAGAKGYLTKNSSKEEMIKAIIEVYKGEQYICDEMRTAVLEEKPLVINNSPTIKLTLREREIVGLIKQGLSSKEIGSQLYVEAKTIEVHRYNILKKLKLPNTAALVNYANINGL